MRISLYALSAWRKSPAIIGVIMLVAGIIFEVDTTLGFALFWVGAALSWSSLIKLLRKTYAFSAGLAIAIIIFFFCFIMAWLLPTAAFVAAGGSYAVFATSAAFLYTKNPSFIVLLESVLVLAIIILVVGGPEFFGRMLAFRDASELTRQLAPSVVAAAATTMTCSYLFLLHFSNGPLSAVKLGPLAAALLAVAVIIAPLYRFVVQAFWEHGVVNALDTGKWWEAFGTVKNEFLGNSSNHHDH